ncbi:MAG: hypothetical protein ACOC2C_05595 [Cyclonatronaceae bacterium]
MSYSELSVRNFKRICIINWSFTLPVLLLFAWPYYLAGSWLGLSGPLLFAGAFIFGLPFMMTVLHGHVTMALGALHRHHYYEWLSRYPLSYGFMFHPVMFRTRFRLIIALLALSILSVSIL